MKKFLKRQKVQYRCATKSGIPICCIGWWMLFYQWLINGPSFWGLKRLREKILHWYWAKVEGYNYIPCPVCLVKNRKVEILMCDCQKERDTCEVFRGI